MQSCRRANGRRLSMKNTNANHISIVVRALDYPLNHLSNPQHHSAPFVPPTFLVSRVNFLHLLFSTTLGGWVFSCSWDKEAGVISRLAASDSRVLRGQRPTEAHKSHTHAHARTEKEIKKISVRDWLPCCLVEPPREVKENNQTYLCEHIS